MTPGCAGHWGASSPEDDEPCTPPDEPPPEDPVPEPVEDDPETIAHVRKQLEETNRRLNDLIKRVDTVSRWPAFR